MAYPTSIDTFQNPSGTSTLANPDHAVQHANLNTAITAIETVMGTTAGTSVLKNIPQGGFASSSSGTETLTNKTLTSPVINSPTITSPTIGTPSLNLGSDAVGDMYYRGSGGTLSRLAAGTANTDKYLSTDGTTPSWVTAPAADGYIKITDTLTYASSTTFTISGVDRTAIYKKGTRLKLTQTTTKYFYVVESSFSTNTTVTVTGGIDYSLANAAITSPYYSYDAYPQNFPVFFQYTPTWTGFSSAPTGTIRFFVLGNVCFITYQDAAGGTSNATTTTVTMPIAASRSLANAGICFVKDNGANSSTPGHFASTASSNVFNVYKSFFQGSWTSSGGKDVYFNPFNYEF